MSSTIYARVLTGAYQSRSRFADGTDGWEVAYRVLTRGHQDVRALVGVIEKAVERAGPGVVLKSHPPAGLGADVQTGGLSFSAQAKPPIASCRHHHVLTIPV
jgi:hypothetical protein